MVTGLGGRNQRSHLVFLLNQKTWLLPNKKTRLLVEQEDTSSCEVNSQLASRRHQEAPGSTQAAPRSLGGTQEAPKARRRLIWEAKCVFLCYMFCSAKVMWGDHFHVEGNDVTIHDHHYLPRLRTRFHGRRE